MADYPILPPTLAALQPVKDFPQGAEDSAKLDDSIRQTRNWMYDFLSLYVDVSTGKLRPDAFLAAGPVPPGSIRGTNGVSGVQQEIAQGSIRTPDLADKAVTAQKIADGTITNSNIADNTIQGVKLANVSVTADKIAADVLTTANIANGAITGDKIANATIPGNKIGNGAIGNANMGSHSVLGPNLPVADAGQILVGGNGTDSKEFAVKTMSGAFAIDANGVVTVNGIGGSLVSFARVVERTNAGTHGGSSTTGWNLRGSSPAPPWSILDATRDFLEINQQKILFKEGGKYLIRIESPMRGNQLNRVAMVFFPDPSNVSSNTVLAYYGSSVDSASAMTMLSTLECVIDVPDVPDTAVARPWIEVYHYTSAGVATNGLGLAVSATAGPTSYVTTAPPEMYAQVHVLRIQQSIS